MLQRKYVCLILCYYLELLREGKMNKYPTKEVIQSADFGAILVCAVRYALGRQSCMPRVVIGYITPLIPELSDQTLCCLERDVRNPTIYGDGGYGDKKIDEPGWIRFLYDLETERRNATYSHGGSCSPKHKVNASIMHCIKQRTYS